MAAVNLNPNVNHNAIAFPLVIFHPQASQYEPNALQQNIPTSQITPADVVSHLKHHLALNRAFLHNYNITAFLATPSGVGVYFNSRRNYLEMLDLFEIVTTYLQSRHPGNGAFTNKTMKYRKLYYKWKKKWGRFYVSPYLRFGTLVKDFLNIIGLPLCFLRITTKNKGSCCFPGLIYRYDANGNKLRHKGKQSGDNLMMSEEWSVRLFGVNVPMYQHVIKFQVGNDVTNDSDSDSDSDSDDNENNGIEVIPTCLFIEKECHLNNMFQEGFHIDHTCILATGSGFASDNCRAFLKFISGYYTSTPNQYNYKIQAFTDLGQGGASIIAALNYQRKPIIPHEIFNVRLGWIGLNPRFMKRVFPNHQYVSTSSQISDTIINNTLHDPNKGFVTNGNTPYERRRRRQVRELLSSADTGNNWSDPKGKTCDIDTLSEQVLHTAIAWLLKHQDKSS